MAVIALIVFFNLLLLGERSGSSTNNLSHRCIMSNSIEKLRNEIFSDISDTFKDIHGCRPRFVNPKEVSMEYLLDWQKSLHEEAELSLERERQEEQKAILMLDEEISRNIRFGAGDRKTAIRWIAQAYDAESDPGYLCYTLRLPFSYKQEFQDCLEQ